MVNDSDKSKEDLIIELEKLRRRKAELKQYASETRLMEAALRESENKFRTVFDLSPQAIALSEVDSGKLVSVNDKFCELTRFSREEVIGRTTTECRFYAEQDRARFLKALQVSGEVHGLEMDFRAKDGSVLHALVFSRIIELGEKKLILNIFNDITEKKRLESQLNEAKILESIATLAGGIAHEFNNALYGITGNIELLKMALPSTQEVDRYLKSMSESAHRMARLTEQLLAYARGGKYRSQTVSLNNVVDQTLPLIQHWIKGNIRVETDLPGDIASIEADLTQMQMVLSAVVANAAEAIQGRGRIRIITRNEEIDQAVANSFPELKPGSYVCLTVKDDGKGMTDETKSRIFEPFFTTKFQGRGLGMAAVFGIVKNHGGWIGVDSNLGEGTIVRIYLPTVAVRAEEARKPSAEMASGTGTVLVVEDEESVMEVNRAILERLGYKVLEAKTGNEAVQLVRNLKVDIDLAILDIGLPDLAGNEVFRILKEARPELKIIVCSGYAIDGPAQEMLNAGAQGFIQKPYAFSTLSAKLKELLYP